LGEKIVRQMLDSETRIVENYGSTDISPSNFDLHFLGQEQINGKRCYVLQLIPLRKDPHLLRGKIWVDASTYLLHRMEGAPPSSPSWWLRDARIAFT
jgi:negative regulator of sigma E activity